MANDIFNKIFPKICIDGKKVRLIELFGGIGSQAKAFEVLHRNYPEKVIFEHYRLVEIDKYCVRSYNAIHNTNFTVKDIKKITTDDLGIEKCDEYVYLMTYSFPCQDISESGLRKGFERGSGTRSSLLWEVIRILEELPNEKRPQILLMENVAAIKHKSNASNFKELQMMLNNLGYKNFEEILNLKDYGLPQNRNRCFMISIKNNSEYFFPKKMKQKHYMQEFLEDIDEVPEEYFLSSTLINTFLDKKPHGLYVRAKRFCPFYFENKNIARTIITKQGSHVSDNFIYYPKDMYKRNREVGIMIKDEREYVLRTITAFEAYILMGFEVGDFNNVKDLLSRTQLTKQAGNSIGVTCLIAIIAMLYSDIDYEKIINDYVDNILFEKKEKIS